MSLDRQLRQEVFDRLGSLGIAARQAVENVLAGRHRSIRRGLSVEFVGHRPYQPGDDLRHLDWFVFARSDRYDVRVYEEETRLRGHLVLDVSGSMGYGSGEITKLQYAKMLVGALAFLMIRQSDSVGLATADSRIRIDEPPRSTMPHLLKLLQDLDGASPGDAGNLPGALETLASRHRRRGLAVIVTDAFVDLDRLRDALRLVRFSRQEIKLFQVLDPREADFALSGPVRLDGLEGERGVRLDPDRVREAYLESFSRHQSRLLEVCHESGASYERCLTNEDLAVVLTRALTHHLPTGARA